MQPAEFCRWLQGFAELNEQAPSDAQWKSIREHLQLVFTKVTPPVSSSTVTVVPDQFPRWSSGTVIC
jgi:hypothetical protein